MKKPLTIGAVGGLAIGLLAFTPLAQAEDTDTYLVTTKPTSGISATSLSIKGEITDTYKNVGVVVAEMTAADAAALNKEPGVVVSKDGPTSIGNPMKPVEKKPGGKPLKVEGLEASVGPNAVASWGLDRIDQRDRPLNGRYSPQKDVDGKGAHIYVVDTGSNTGHTEFSGRAGNSANFVNDGRGATTSCHFHGTHVMGTAAGRTYGVAKKATVHAVRVLGCNGGGTWSAYVGAMNWIIANAKSSAVVNASMGGARNDAVNVATGRVILSGVTFVTSAGNSADNAYWYSPASLPGAITVAASDASDFDAPYSNYGTVVDLFAPGSSVRSIGGTASGTSMASPHVAGNAALILGERRKYDPQQVEYVLKAHGTKNRIRNEVGGTPDILPYVRSIQNRDTTTKVKRVKRASRLRIDVNPNQSSWNYKVRVQKKVGRGYRTVKTVRTRGSRDIVTVNMGRGRYRAKTPNQHGGYRGSTSRSVFLRR